MKITCCMLLACVSLGAAQADQSEDRRVVRAKGYHIIARPARTGETPPEVKQEKAEENRQRRQDTDIANQTIPTRAPELKPNESKP